MPQTESTVTTSGISEPLEKKTSLQGAQQNAPLLSPACRERRLTGWAVWVGCAHVCGSAQVCYTAEPTESPVSSALTDCPKVTWLQPQDQNSSVQDSVS